MSQRIRKYRSFTQFAVATALFLAGCSTGPQQVSRAWSSSGAVQYANTDSLAACPDARGDVRVFATAKDGHRLDVFDAATGRFIKSFGAPGTLPGQFQRPNGIAVAEFEIAGKKSPVLLVVERDNRRVQAVLPDGPRSAGAFGQDVLQKPYGCAVSYQSGGVRLYVTDTGVPSEKTVHIFDLWFDGTTVAARHAGVFGEASGPGRFVQVESIVIDDALGRVLICDEPPKHVKVYDLSGRFTGTTFGDGLVQGDPEGLVVLDNPGGGVVLLTDQRPEISLWHAFDRRTYAWLGTFTANPTVANTDGICVYPRPFGGFRSGAFFAVNNDLDICAMDIKQICEAIGPMPRRQR